VFAAMVVPSASTKIGPVIGVTFVFVVVTATRLRCRFYHTSCCYCVVPEANGAAGFLKYRLQ
jgi:hypothetical protein